MAENFAGPAQLKRDFDVKPAQLNDCFEELILQNDHFAQQLQHVKAQMERSAKLTLIQVLAEPQTKPRTKDWDLHDIDEVCPYFLILFAFE